jgi:23S rRNA pseudouridine2457 synthase
LNFYAIIYKPFQVLSQFSSADGKQNLKDFFQVPRDVYPVGRLDYDSEGLLLLTNDKELNHRLLQPRFEHQREYWVQVEGAINPEAIDLLQSGMDINLDGKVHRTKRCLAKSFPSAPPLPDRNPPIRFRKNIPTSWISLVLTEGKNRQVRKMTAKAGYPTLRLVRFRIEGITIAGMSHGDILLADKKELYQKLFSNDSRHSE